MRIDELIIREYPVIGYYSGVSIAEVTLTKNNYLIVIDDDNNFKGVLTPRDLVQRPHKIVADCLIEKETLSIDDSLISAMEVFERNNTVALPVFNDEKFEGILEKHTVFAELHKEAKALYHKSVSAENVKNNFLENLSHEIRTPLNGIIGFIELLEENNGQNALVDKKSAHAIIKECTNRFLLTMQNLTELALIQSGIKNCFKMEQVHINLIFNDIERYFNSIGSKYGDKTKIIFMRNDYNPCLYTDKEVLTEILFHLVTSTITLFGSNIVYIGDTVPEGSDYIILYVTNNCRSVKDQCLDLFNRPDEEDAKVNLYADGMGIGMTLVREYGSLINAEIKIENSYNTNTFYCKLPLIKEKDLISNNEHPIINHN
jgi:K+-sensing histidine kinase KdpD